MKRLLQVLIPVMTLVVGPASAGSSTVTSCYSSAETAYSGLSISVKSGSTTLLTSSDLDAVMDKIADNHTDTALNLTYNSDGQNALKYALDCIFDAGHLTLSSVWTNENESGVAMRTYTVVLTDGEGTPLVRYVFDSLDTSGVDTIEFVQSYPTSECGTTSLVVSTLGSNDYWGEFWNSAEGPKTTHICDGQGCDVACGTVKDNCPCSQGEPGCSKISKNAFASNGSIMKLEP